MKAREAPQRDELIALAAGLELWRDPEGNAHASLPVAGHVEHWPVRSVVVRHWLTDAFWRARGSAPAAQAMEEALRVLEAIAWQQGSVHATATRVGEAGGRLHLDLGDPEWRAVEIAGDGWRVVECSGVRFLRAPSMQPLPLPERGELIEPLLRRYLNLSTDADLMLTVAWMCAALLPHGPYPILSLNGEQGTAKSTASRILKMTIDPALAPIRAPPRAEQDLVVAAHAGHVVAYDNVSGLPGHLSDAMCRLASGGGFATRRLYTDMGEVVFEGARPIILNGIPDVVGRPDLADRAVVIALAPIAPAARRPERELWQAFQADRPALLGALLDALAVALRVLPEVRLDDAPRMADFARLGVALERGLGWPAGAFRAAYEANRAATMGDLAENDPVAGALVRLMADRREWEGTATELLAALEPLAPEAVRRSRAWPAGAASLSSRIGRIAPALRSTARIEILRVRLGGTGRRLVSLRRF